MPGRIKAYPSIFFLADKPSATGYLLNFDGEIGFQTDFSRACSKTY
jgi:hypothetical protein